MKYKLMICLIKMCRIITESESSDNIQEVELRGLVLPLQAWLKMENRAINQPHTAGNHAPGHQQVLSPTLVHDFVLPLPASIYNTNSTH